ncbi:MAG: hypothetical protein HYS22_08180 [Deltaproteobacteria bacterium]|nr:hypothetical protein [Deltaproteobacteria bacterium]
MRKTQFLLSLFFLLMTSCSMKVTGQVYLDENEDQYKGEKEAGLTGLAFTVSMNGEPQGEGVTGADGKYEFKDFKNSTEGKICVKISQASLTAKSSSESQPSQGTGSVKKEEQAMVLQAVTEEPASQPTSDDNQGGAESQPNTAGAGPESSKTGATQQPGSLESCIDKAFGEIEISIAIPPLYSDSLALIAKEETRSLKVGEVVPIPVRLLSRCEAQPLVLPQGVEVVSEIMKPNPTTRQLVIAKPKDQKPTSTGVPGGEVTTTALPIRLTKEAPAEVSLTPTMICKNDKLISLPTITLKKIAEPDFLVEQSMSGQIALNQQITVLVTAKNNGAADLSSGTLTVDLPKFVTGVTVETGCNNLGQKVQCGNLTIPKGQALVKTVSFVLPERLTQDTDFEVNSSLTAATLPQEVKAEKITFSLVGPPQEEEGEAEN